jgi:pentalenic acid synthase
MGDGAVTEDIAAGQASEEIPFPQQRTSPLEFTQSYLRLTALGPMCRVKLYNGKHAWLVTSHEMARRLLSDPRLSSERDKDGYPFLAPRFEAAARIRTPLIGSDPPSHDLHRKILNPDFSLKRTREMRDDIERIVNRLIDDIIEAGPPVDLVSKFTLPVPSMGISLLLGVPYEDHDFFHGAIQRVMVPERPEDAAQAANDLLGYLDTLIASLRKTPGAPGLLSRLAAEQPDDASVSHQELVHLAFVLILTGHDSTAGTLALAVISLLEHPDQLAEFLSQQEMSAGVEELLRYVTVTDHIGLRAVTEDIEIAGERIAAGDGVIFSGTLANRDPAVFSSPEVLDVGREDARRHLAFGYGIHQCVGQNLARLELEVALNSLFRRIPSLRLAVPPGELAVRPADTVGGVMELPVTW